MLGQLNLSNNSIGLVENLSLCTNLNTLYIANNNLGREDGINSILAL